MLELALAAVRTAESDEMDHARKAHRRLEKAAQLEHSLEKAEREIHHEAVDADSIIETYEKENILEDREKRREIAVSEIAHHVENYVESRLAELRKVEENAKQEEHEAEEHLAELLVNEGEIRATLEELKSLRKQMTDNEN
jgi:hypothetical protein